MTVKDILAEIDAMAGDAAGFHSSTAIRVERLEGLKRMVEQLDAPGLPPHFGERVYTGEVLEEEEYTDGSDAAGSGRLEGADSISGGGSGAAKEQLREGKQPVRARVEALAGPRATLTTLDSEIDALVA
jgi:hypothetical protein